MPLEKHALQAKKRPLMTLLVRRGCQTLVQEGDLKDFRLSAYGTYVAYIRGGHFRNLGYKEG